jgi:nucleoid-associated protein YgaU
MTRVLAIVALIGLFTVTGTAGADVSSPIRHPATSEAAAPLNDTSPDTVVVEKGDHLWKISATHLGEGASDVEIAPFWRDVVEVNAPRLRSGDPDLIYPGEIVELPSSP